MPLSEKSNSSGGPACVVSSTRVVQSTQRLGACAKHISMSCGIGPLSAASDGGSEARTLCFSRNCRARDCEAAEQPEAAERPAKRKCSSRKNVQDDHADPRQAALRGVGEQHVFCELPARPICP